MKTVLTFSAFLGAILMCGCASDATLLQTGNARRAISPSQVRVYLKAPPNSEQIGVVSFSDTSHFSRQKLQDSILQRLKEKAAAKGANGLVVIGSGSGEAAGPYLGPWAGGSGMFSSKEETVKAIAIYVP